MKFVCERCHTKYSIADEKVRGKVLKVRCKTCENIITVREGGATIDDAHSDHPKEAPLSRSGTLDGGAGVGAGGAVGAATAPAGRRLSGAVAPVGNAAGSAASARPAIPAAAFTDPLAPSVAPPPRRHAPTPGPLAALATIEDDGLDWYLAVDGAQTGPFNRPTLIQKILAVPAGGDIHIWNADLGAWKPPKEVADVLADLVRVKRASQPPAAPRRPTGAVPALPTHGAGADPAAHRTGANGISALAGHGAGGGFGGAAGEHKSNGLGAPTGAAAAPGTVASTGRGGPLTVEDLFTESGATAIAPAANGAGALPAATMTSSGGIAPAFVAGALGHPSRQVKLMIGAGALVAIICGIVAVAALRKPAAPSAPTGLVAEGAKAAKLPESVPPAAAPATPPSPTPPVVAEAPSVAKIDGHPDPRAERGSKGGRVKGRRKGEGGLSPTSPPPLPGTGAGLSADQLQAASRFGDSTAREVRGSSSSGSGARSTPAQADISRVITNNRQGIQTCYQRALLRDSTLTQGRVTVRVWIGLSGKVKSVSLDAPAAFRSMEPCVRDVMSRWAFPPSSEEYGTEFPFLLQGNQ